MADAGKRRSPDEDSMKPGGADRRSATITGGRGGIYPLGPPWLGASGPVELEPSPFGINDLLSWVASGSEGWHVASDVRRGRDRRDCSRASPNFSRCRAWGTACSSRRSSAGSGRRTSRFQRESPYLAFIVGMHVATAIAMIIFFWRDWVRIIGRLLLDPARHPARAGHQAIGAAGYRPDARLDDHPGHDPGGHRRGRARAPVPHRFSKPLLASSFLFVNGLILLIGERARRRGAAAESEQVAMDVPDGGRAPAGRPSPRRKHGRRSVKPQALRPGSGRSSRSRPDLAVQADRRLVGVGFTERLLARRGAGTRAAARISRDGLHGRRMFDGLSRQDAARFSFLLSTPVILAAGVLRSRT